MVSTGAVMRARISLIASYVSFQFSGAGWGVFNDCGMAFGFRGEDGDAFAFTFAFEGDLTARLPLSAGSGRGSLAVFRKASLSDSVNGSTLLRFERRVAGRLASASSASKRVTEGSNGLACDVSCAALDAVVLFMMATRKEREKHVMEAAGRVMTRLIELLSEAESVGFREAIAGIEVIM